MASVPRRVVEHSVRFSARMLAAALVVAALELAAMWILYSDLRSLSVSNPLTLFLTLAGGAALVLGVASIVAAVLIGLLECLMRERRARYLGVGLAAFGTLALVGVSMIQLVYPSARILYTSWNLIAYGMVFGGSLVVAVVLALWVRRREPKPVRPVTAIAGAGLWVLVLLGWLLPFGIRLEVSARSDPVRARTRPAGVAAPLEEAPVVLVTVDTLRASHMSMYGYPRRTTPGIDALSAEGTVFARAMTPKSSTGPAVASLLTGLYPDAHQVLRNGIRLNESLTTIAERMTEAGYRSACFITNPYISGRKRGFRQGFTDVHAYGEHGVTAARIAGDAMEWLRKQEERRFFLWVHVADPHTPYEPPAPWDGRFQGDETSRRFADVRFEIVDGRTDLGEVNPAGTLGKDWKKRNLTPEQIRSADYYVSQYDGEIGFTDEWIARLLKLARERFPDALVLFAADHGESMVEHNHFFFHSRFCYDTTAHIPLIVWNPSARGPETTDRLVGLADLFPTLCDLVGIAPPERVEGRSFADVWYPEFRSPPGKRPGVLVGSRSSLTHPVRGIRTEKWKLLLDPRRVFAPIDLLLQRQLLLHSGSVFVGPHLLRSYDTELYDLVADPGETKDVSEEHPKVRERLRRALVEEAQAHWLDRLALAVTGNMDEFDESEMEELRSLGYVR